VFKVSPLNLCKGSQVTVSLSFKGQAKLTADPTVPGLERLESSGTKSFPLQTNTAFTLTVSGVDPPMPPDTRRVTILDTSLEDPNAPGHPIAFEAQREGPATLAARGDLTEGTWDPEIQIGTVASGCKCPLRVRHEGREAAVSGDGRPSDALRGTKLIGHWELSTDPASGAAPCDPDLCSDMLGVAVSFTCRP
jgi:hypothetical protein